jgi:hypothetical protein
MKTILIGFSAAHTASDTNAVRAVSAIIARKYLFADENSMVSVPCIGIRPAGRPLLFIIGRHRVEARDGVICRLAARETLLYLPAPS